MLDECPDVGHQRVVGFGGYEDRVEFVVGEKAVVRVPGAGAAEGGVMNGVEDTITAADYVSEPGGES